MIKVVSFGFFCVLLAFGQGQSKGKGRGQGGHPNAESQGDSSSVSAGLSVAFGSDRALIRQYARSISPSNLPPGLAKRGGNLPPGIEKQLRRNGRLPPGLERQMSAFPPELERRLVPLPSAYTRAFIGGRALIYNKSTSLILDVFVPLP